MTHEIYTVCGANSRPIRRLYHVARSTIVYCMRTEVKGIKAYEPVVMLREAREEFI